MILSRLNKHRSEELNQKKKKPDGDFAKKIVKWKMILFLPLLKQFQNFQKLQGWFMPKIAPSKYMIMVNHAKPTSTLYWK